ncbi:metalloregulator ArsR/SmtB family transcription factor [Curtobacterium sp. MCBD17_040]|uniref:ArsR/SmtB family transcription factor n=1 Tax=Curtobacterium sp. MCBD17_040 TaxID=2175674 RepID=UPI0021ABD928|nr:metalloregulator ArsR/SmtB family transcription factor [Curtobacterium sp. MCBD17_040]WIB63391.1 metalloregulator ArsR/SmtB family transcription factor [Curtobacterium sp. MCBD17_040]
MTDHRVSIAAELFKALSSPARLRVLVALIEAPCDVSSLAAQTELSQPLVSQHLRTLRLAGLVEVERIGRNAVYSFRDEHVAHIVSDALTHVGEAAA